MIAPFKKIVLDVANLKIILLDQNNYVERLSVDVNMLQTDLTF